MLACRNELDTLYILLDIHRLHTEQSQDDGSSCTIDRIVERGLIYEAALLESSPVQTWHFWTIMLDGLEKRVIRCFFFLKQKQFFQFSSVYRKLFTDSSWEILGNHHQCSTT